MGEFVAGLDIGHHRLGRAVDRVAGREEGRLDVVALEQGDQAGNDHDVKFAARYGGRRGQLTGDEAGQMVVVESEADDVTLHVAGPLLQGGSLSRFVAFAHGSLHDAGNEEDGPL